MQETFKKVTQYLCEDPETTQPEEFFAMIARFGKGLNNAFQQSQMAAVNAEKLKKREEARQIRLNALNKAVTRDNM